MELIFISPVPSQVLDSLKVKDMKEKFPCPKYFYNSGPSFELDTFLKVVDDKNCYIRAQRAKEPKQ